MIIDTLKLPKLVMPVATLTIGWPDEQPAQSDRLPLRSIIHNEHFEDYTPEKLMTSMPRKKHWKRTRSLYASTT